MNWQDCVSGVSGDELDGLRWRIEFKVFQSVRGLEDDSVTRFVRKLDLALEIRDLTKLHWALNFLRSKGDFQRRHDRSIYGQCIWRKVQDVGLAGEYNAGGNVQAFIQKCIAVSFIPPSEVNDKFHELVHCLGDEVQTKLASFIDYFRATWLGGMFPIPMWNK